MDWVHCNFCYVQPSPNKTEIAFSLTSCGHIHCSKCQRKDQCSVCSSKCSVVSLSKQLPSDVLMYFTSPVNLIEKFCVQIERVRKFQKTQKERLFKHRKDLIHKRGQELLKEVQTLEREVEELQSHLTRKLTESPTYQSPMATGSPFDSTNCPQSLTVSSSPIVHQTSQPVKASTATTGHILTPKTSQPHFQELSEIHSQCATTQPHSQPQVSMQPRSHSKPDEGFKSTPSSMQLRLMLAASGHQSGHRTPPPGQPPSVLQAKKPKTSGNTTPKVPTRLCIRTPPIDGKIGIIPGSSEARQKILSPVGGVGSGSGTVNELVAREVARLSPRSLGKPLIYTPNSQDQALQCQSSKGRSIFPHPYTPTSRSPSPRTWTMTPVGMAAADVPLKSARKTH